MKLLSLTEGLSHPCIVVDVQPEYANYSKNNYNVCLDIINFVNKQTGPVLMFVNAEYTGLSNDTIQDIQYFWEEHGFNEQKWRRVKIVDKGYGHFRSLMDKQVPEYILIKVIRRLYHEKLNDVRELFDKHDDLEDFFEGYEDLFIDERFIINWTNVAQLKQFNNAYIMGGGRNECLREVELLMNAFNIKYKKINTLVY